MNVQFSLSANSVSGGQNKPEQAVSNAAVPIDRPAIRDGQDLVAQERKGVNVSVAEEQLIRTIERAVKALQGPQTTLEVSIHEKTHDIMVKVLNKDTGELIREIPPEKTLDLVAKMMEIAGILVDEKI